MSYFSLLTVLLNLGFWVHKPFFHTTSIHEILENYVAKDFGKVYLGDGSTLNILGIGDVCIRVHIHSVWKLQKIRHILELKNNLISVGQLDDEGHFVNFHGGKWKVCTGAKILASGYKTDILYMTTSIRDIIIVTGASVDPKMWYGVVVLCTKISIIKLSLAIVRILIG
jgi:hypothetical protein